MRSGFLGHAVYFRAGRNAATLSRTNGLFRHNYNVMLTVAARGPQQHSQRTVFALSCRLTRRVALPVAALCASVI